MSTITLKELKNILIGAEPIASLPDIPRRFEPSLLSSKAILSSIFFRLNRFPSNFSIKKDRIAFFFKREFNPQYLVSYDLMIHSPKDVSLTITTLVAGALSSASIKVPDTEAGSLNFLESILEVAKPQAAHFIDYPDDVNYVVVRNESCFSGSVVDSPVVNKWDSYFM